jgi:hypothetical protein
LAVIVRLGRTTQYSDTSAMESRSCSLLDPLLSRG